MCTPLLRSSTTLRTRPSSLDAERHPRWGIVAARSGVAASRAVRSTASSRGACHCVCVHIPPPHIMTLHDCPLLHISVYLMYIYIHRNGSPAISYCVFGIHLLRVHHTIISAAVYRCSGDFSQCKQTKYLMGLPGLIMHRSCVYHMHTQDPPLSLHT